MCPKHTDAERGVDMLETKVYCEVGTHCQTCLAKLIVGRTFLLNALKDNVSPLSNYRVLRPVLRVKKRGVSSKYGR